MRDTGSAEVCISAAGQTVGLYRPTEPNGNSCSNGLRLHSLMSLLCSGAHRKGRAVPVWTLVSLSTRPFCVYLPTEPCGLFLPACFLPNSAALNKRFLLDYQTWTLTVHHIHSGNSPSHQSWHPTPLCNKVWLVSWRKQPTW